ncbi:MAG: DUF5420 family protein [Proteobacteria bacterium]|nr:DUF5420 family protein [Pseudomonadota bacterium]
MPDYKLRYFIAEGPRADQIANEGIAKREQWNADRDALLNEIGAVGIYGNTSFIKGVTFESRDNRPGYIRIRSIIDGGKKLYVFCPDQRTEIGKEIAKRIKGFAIFDFSEYVCHAYNVTQSVITSLKSKIDMVHSVAGYIHDRLVFKIPFGGYNGFAPAIDVEIPDDFKELSESQFIAFVHEGKPLDQLVA